MRRYSTSSLSLHQCLWLKPTTAVGLIPAVFAAASSSFTTACVEQSLWLKLGSRRVSKPLTVRLSHRQGADEKRATFSKASSAGNNNKVRYNLVVMETRLCVSWKQFVRVITVAAKMIFIPK